MSDRYINFREEKFANAVEEERNKEFPNSTIVSLGEKMVSRDNVTELSEVYKLFNLAGFVPTKNEKPLSANELAMKFQNIPNLAAQVRNKKLVITVSSNDKSFVYIGLPADFYAKYLKYEKLKKGYLQAIDKKKKNDR